MSDEIPTRIVPVKSPNVSFEEYIGMIFNELHLPHEANGRPNRIEMAFTEVGPRSKFYPGTPVKSFDGVTNSNVVIILKDKKVTMSQPTLLADELLAIDNELRQPNIRVLEVGAATGYLLAILSKLVDGEVYGMEIDPDMIELAGRNLPEEHYGNVKVLKGDGLGGLPGKEPLDIIIVSAGVQQVPRALYDELKVGGKMIIPIFGPLRGTDGNVYNYQLAVVTKTENGYDADVDPNTRKLLTLAYFVDAESPLHGGWPTKS